VFGVVLLLKVLHFNIDIANAAAVPAVTTQNLTTIELTSNEKKDLHKSQPQFAAKQKYIMTAAAILKGYYVYCAEIG
jgi:hypothetical protein